MRILKHRKTDRPRAINRQRHEDNAARVKVHVTKGDTVRVIRGEHRGKEGKILHVYPKRFRVVVEGVNIVKKERGLPVVQSLAADPTMSLLRTAQA